MTTETIDITPRFNEARIQEYAETNFTRDPQTHITAKLEVLAELSNLIDEFQDGYDTVGQRLDGLVAEIGRKHREVSSELLSWFAP